MAWEERGKLGTIPAGGEEGQVLAKASSADRDVMWMNSRGEGLPPPPAVGYVYGVDELGVAGWVEAKQLEGSTAWLTTNFSSSFTVGETKPVPFGDAENSGQMMWSDLDPTKMVVRRSGYYRITGGMSIAHPGAACWFRMRFVVNEGAGSGNTVRPYDLTGRVSAHAANTASPIPTDFSAVSGPVYLEEGDFVQMTVYSSTSGTRVVQAAGRASWMSLERMG